MNPNLSNTLRFLASLEIWILVVLVASSMVVESLLPITIIVALFFIPVRWLAYGRLTRRTPVDIALILLLVMVPVTLWATALPDVTDPQVYRLLSGIALFYAIVNWSVNSTRLRWIVLGALLAGLILALGAAFSVQWAVDKLPFIPDALYQRFTLLVADTVHPNVMAGSLVILLPLSLAGLLYGWRQLDWSWRVLMSVALFVMSGILVLTQSRGAWMAFGVVIVLLLALRWSWSWLFLPLSAAGTVIAFYLVGLIPILDALSSSATISGLDGRTEIWSRAIYMIQDFPFTGIGMGSFGRVADTLYPFFLTEPGKIPHAHNIFLQVAVDLGIPGLISWLAILGTVIVAAWQVYRRGREVHDGWITGLGAGLLGSQVALMVHGLMDAVTWGMVKPAPIVWALWGLTIATWYVYVRPLTHPESHPQPGNYPPISRPPSPVH